MAHGEAVAYLYACVAAHRCVLVRSSKQFNAVGQRLLRDLGRLRECAVVVVWWRMVRVNHATASMLLAYRASWSHVSTSITGR